MPLLDQIQTDLKAARQARDKVRADVLGTLLGAIDTASHEPKKPGPRSENQIRDIAASQRKSMLETISLLAGRDRPDALAKAQAEVEVISAYLPSMLTETELTAILTVAVKDGMKRGPLMGMLKAQYNWRYDGAVVNRLLSALETAA